MANTALIFLSSIAGIMLYFTTLTDEALVFGLLVLALAFFMTLAGTSMVRTNPVVATYLLVAWRAFPLAVVFAGGYFSAWLSLNILEHLPFEFTTDQTGTPEEIAAALKAQKSTASSLMIAAINTFLGAILIDAAKDPDSSFWPTTLHKKALKREFDGKTNKDTSTWAVDARHALEDLRYAYGEERSEDNSIVGWEFGERVKRAKVIKTSLKVLEQHKITI
ncbi:MAG: hypothetical protein AAF718_08645 [Pseudomonadota bacterium]